jgi:hypothetical protein
MGLLSIREIKKYLPEKYPMGYKISQEVSQYVREDLDDYIMMLHTNSVFRRKTYKAKHNIKQRGAKSDDLVVTLNFRDIHSLCYDPMTYNMIIDGISKDGTLTATEKQHAIDNIKITVRRLATGDFEVKPYDVDGRFHTVFTQTNKRLRDTFYIKEDGRVFVNAYNVDIRAEHPSFLAEFLKFCSELPTKFSINVPISSSRDSSRLPSTPIVTDNVDRYKVLNNEVDRWNSLWTAEKDPREVMAKAQNTTKDHIKKGLLVDLNERRNYSTPFKDWFKAEFPMLYEIWRNTDVAMTGCNLSKLFESGLLRVPELYQLAESLGVRILDCHDGLSVFVEDGDSCGKEKAEKLKECLVELSVKKFGLRPIIKVEDVL